jgi:hypothetical protein
MKTYNVSFKYETYANYEIEAANQEEAELLALELLKNDEGDYLHNGSWTDTEIEEVIQ